MRARMEGAGRAVELDTGEVQVGLELMVSTMLALWAHTVEGTGLGGGANVGFQGELAAPYEGGLS